MTLPSLMGHVHFQNFHCQSDRLMNETVQAQWAFLWYAEDGPDFTDIRHHFLFAPDMIYHQVV